MQYIRLWVGEVKGIIILTAPGVMDCSFGCARNRKEAKMNESEMIGTSLKAIEHELRGIREELRKLRLGPEDY
jgi:hypothetical protein